MGKYQKSKEESRLKNPMKLRCCFLKKYFGSFWLHLKKLFNKDQKSNTSSTLIKNKRPIRKLIPMQEISESNGEKSLILSNESQNLDSQIHEVKKKKKNRKISIITTPIQKNEVKQKIENNSFKQQNQPHFQRQRLQILRYLYEQPQYQIQNKQQSYCVVNPINNQTHQDKRHSNSNIQQPLQKNAHKILQQNTICIDKKISIFQQINTLLSDPSRNSQVYSQQMPEAENFVKKFEKKLSKIERNIEQRNIRKKLISKLNEQVEQNQQQIREEIKPYNIEDIVKILKSPLSAQQTPVLTAETLFHQTIKSLQQKKQHIENQPKCKIQYVEPDQHDISMQKPQELQPKPFLFSIPTHPTITTSKMENPFIREKVGSSPSLLSNLMKSTNSDIQSFMKQASKQKPQQHQQTLLNPPQPSHIPPPFSQNTTFASTHLNYFSQSTPNPFLFFTSSQTKYPQNSSLFFNSQPQSTKLPTKQDRKKKNKEERIY